MSSQIRKNPQQPRAQATVEAITNASLLIINEAGTAALTTANIAERAGVSIGTLYRYFPDKKSILLKVYGDVLLELEASLERLTDPAKAPPTWKEYVRILQAGIAKYEEPHRPVISSRATMMYPEFAELDHNHSQRQAKKFARMLTHYGSLWPTELLEKLAMFCIYLNDGAWHLYRVTNVYDPLVAQWQFKAAAAVFEFAFEDNNLT
jgi:AcrR family transcriptional regulator